MQAERFPNPARGSTVPRWIQLFFAIDALLVAVYAVNAWLDVPPGKYAQFFDLDEEANLPAWYSSMQLGGAAGLIAFFAWRSGATLRRGARLLWALAALLVLLSLDESAQIHEWIGDRLSRLFADAHPDSFLERTRSWTSLVTLPLVVFLVWLFRGLKDSLSAVPRATRLLAAGFTLLLLSAEGLELLSDLTGLKAHGYTMEVCAEELGEMLAATVLLWGGWVMAETALSPVETPSRSASAQAAPHSSAGGNRPSSRRP